ncbi:hypothetical protein AMTRI_Chr11g98880 [Amborella trichopoda]
MFGHKSCIQTPVTQTMVLPLIEPAPGTDSEALEVVRECLGEFFKLNSSSVNDVPQPNSLINIFNSLEASERTPNANFDHTSTPEGATTATTVQPISIFNDTEASASLSADGSNGTQVPGTSKDELFGLFLGALEREHFFNNTSGDADNNQLAKAKCAFDDAVKELESSGCKHFDAKALAEALKSLGNRAMQSKLYTNAIELYTFAIALCGSNAVYYCNRAAAFTQVHRYIEAIRDCYNSIEIDPDYSKAYSRLGLAYYAQGNYSDAINKGFAKALLLDPNNSHIRDNIQAAEEKLKEEYLRREGNQGAGPSESQVRNGQSARPRNRSIPFPSMPFNGPLPTDLASMLMNMATGAYNVQTRPQGSNQEETGEPEIRIDGNISLNFTASDTPEEAAGAWRSVMDMFSNAASDSQGSQHRDSAPN